jgi:hypothetical protein
MPETIKAAKDIARYYMSKDIPLYLHGAPGIGKSQSLRQIADEEDIGFIDIRLGSLMPEDLSGIPVPDLEKKLAVWLESEFWPNVKRDGKRGIICFDELSDASRALQSCAYKIILERQHLPPGWWPCAAGNRREDRAAAGSISTALANRFAHCEVMADVDTSVEYFNSINVDPLIPGFLRFRPALLHSMEGANLLAFPTPRAWEQVSKVVHAPKGLRFKLVRGLVGEGAAGEFEAYAKVDNLPSLDEIVANPAKCRIPSEPGTKYALSSMLARFAERGNFDKIVQYIKREEFGRDFEICTVLDATKRDASLCETKAFVDFAKRNSDLQL